MGRKERREEGREAGRKEGKAKKNRKDGGMKPLVSTYSS